MKNDPIILVDDDHDDLELMQDVIKQMNIPNEVIAFDNALTFLDYVKTTKNRAFFILCDINMSPLNGLELREMIYEDEELRLKLVPFVFVSTSNAPKNIMKAYSFGVQGYFVKPSTFQGMKDMLASIIEYWNRSRSPGAVISS